MKIVVLSSHTPSLLWFRLDMMRAFLRCGHTVTAVGNEAEALWTDAFAASGIRYRQVRLSRNGTNPLKDLETLRSLLGILREERPDKIFAYQAKTVIYGSLAAQKLGISEFYPLIAGVGSVFLSETWKARLVRQILTMEYKAALRRCPHYFFQNADDVALFERCRLIEPQRVCMLSGSGVNLEKFECQPLPDAPARFRGPAAQVAHVGRSVQMHKPRRHIRRFKPAFRPVPFPGDGPVIPFANPQVIHGQRRAGCFNHPFHRPAAQRHPAAPRRLLQDSSRTGSH